MTHGSFPKLASTVAALLLLVGSAAPAAAQPGFTEGANVLFAGHSFFGPVARSFDRVAVDNNFPAHTFQYVQRGGANGSPASLWDDTDGSRTEIETALSTGQVELFGLTAYSANDSTLNDYMQWFDLAKSYNDDTSFFIGIPWVIGGPGMDGQTFEQLIEQAGDEMFNTVIALRQAYPDNPIYFLNYGRTSSNMRLRFDAGQLPDIQHMVGSDESALFSDQFGHAGPMMLELSSLSWMETLYGADVAQLSFTDYQSDVVSIVREVTSFNAPYQPAPVTISADSFNVARGSYQSGGLSELELSDNQDVTVNRGGTDVAGIVEIEFTGTSPYRNPEAVRLTIESSGFFRSEVTQTVEAWDFANETWVEVDTRPLSQFGDMTVTITSNANIERFVDQQSREVLVRAAYSTAVGRQAYSIGVDRITWTFQ